MKKELVFVIVFFTVLALMAGLTLFLPAKEFSDNENRTLAQFPQLSWQSVQSGQFQEGLSDFLSDQIPGRDSWIRANTALKKLLGQQEINGVYLGRDGYYFQQFTDADFSQKQAAQVFALIEQFAQNSGLPVYLMPVPTPATVLTDKLPDQAPVYDADAQFAALAQATPSCTFIDLRADFAQAAEGTQLYYRTDHHWTTQGAGLAYKAYCEAAGLTYREQALTRLSDCFYGTVYSKTLDASAQPDELWALAQTPELRVRYDDGEEQSSIYFPENLEKKDQYTYFFGGNWGKVEIQTGASGGRRLLVVKDSFANCFLPYLLGDYEQITLVDLRYYPGSVSQLAQEQGSTEVLILYEMSNLLTDTGIIRLTRA